MKLCPYCDRELVKRKGKYGEFMGCSRYPNCAFTQKVNGKETKVDRLDKAATEFLKSKGFDQNGEWKGRR